MDADRGKSSFTQAVGSLARDLPRLPAAQASGRIASLRRLALAENCPAAAEIADALGAALACDRRGTSIAMWLDVIAEAGRARAAAAAAPVYLATIGARLAG